MTSSPEADYGSPSGGSVISISDADSVKLEVQSDNERESDAEQTESEATARRPVGIQEDDKGWHVQIADKGAEGDDEEEESSEDEESSEEEEENGDENTGSAADKKGPPEHMKSPFDEKEPIDDEEEKSSEDEESSEEEEDSSSENTKSTADKKNPPEHVKSPFDEKEPVDDEEEKSSEDEESSEEEDNSSDENTKSTAEKKNPPEHMKSPFHGKGPTNLKEYWAMHTTHWHQYEAAQAWYAHKRDHREKQVPGGYAAVGHHGGQSTKPYEWDHNNWTWHENKKPWKVAVCRVYQAAFNYAWNGTMTQGRTDFIAAHSAGAKACVARHGTACPFLLGQWDPESRLSRYKISPCSNGRCRYFPFCNYRHGKSEELLRAPITEDEMLNHTKPIVDIIKDNVTPGGPNGWTLGAEPGWPGYTEFSDDASPKRSLPITEEDLRAHTLPIVDSTAKKRRTSEDSESLWEKLGMMVLHKVPSAGS